MKEADIVAAKQLRQFHLPPPGVGVNILGHDHFAIELFPHRLGCEVTHLKVLVFTGQVRCESSDVVLNAGALVGEQSDVQSYAWHVVMHYNSKCGGKQSRLDPNLWARILGVRVIAMPPTLPEARL